MKEEREKLSNRLCHEEGEEPWTSALFFSVWISWAEKGEEEEGEDIGGRGTKLVCHMHGLCNLSEDKGRG